MDDYTITGSYTLPSLGKVYKTNVNPNVTLRSMTVSEEMKRLNPSERPYKTMADIIDSCLLTNPGISSYDMCLGDYQFLLYKLRVVTYGAEYKLSTQCPHCGCTNEGSVNIEQMNVLSFSEDIMNCLDINLPRTNKHITLKMQTPRMLDDVSIRAKELRKKARDFQGDPAFLFTVQSLIDTVDGQKVDAVRLEEFVKTLPMKDTYTILNAASKFNEGIGLDTTLENSCDICGLDYKSSFRTNSEFFRPTED